MTASSHDLEKKHGGVETDAGFNETHKKEPTICRYGFDTYRYRYILQEFTQDRFVYWSLLQNSHLFVIIP